VDGGGVRLPARAWAGLWSDLVHVISNAIDHGLESPAVRQRAGKPAIATLKLSTRLADRRIVIEIEDDGAGIDWGAIRNAASRRGLPHETQEDLIRAMFAPDVSTRSEVTTVSGRGVGLAAVQSQMEALGGTTQVRSRPGQGACFTFMFPVPAIGGARGPDAQASEGRIAVA